MGYWFRGQHELLMVATSGSVSPPVQSLRIPSVIKIRRGSHSSKPDQIRDYISKWFPDVPKMKMFARAYTDFWPKHDGWDVWGNEIENDTQIQTNPLFVVSV